MRPARFTIFVMAALLAGGCMRRPPPVAGVPLASGSELDAYTIGAAVPRGVMTSSPAAAPAAIAYADSNAEGPYVLDSGDRLRVVVFGQDGLSNSYGVDVAGNITMPLIGAVPARGQTTAALGRAIAARLRQGYIREPYVAVEIEAYRPFFILGEVAFPGQYPYVANMTVETAVAIAGGFSPRASRDSVELTRTNRGQSYRSTVPVVTAVRPGDTISVAERWF